MRFPDGDRDVSVSVPANGTGDALKAGIRQATGQPEAGQRLIFQGQEVQGVDLLKERRMVDGCVVLCQVRLCLRLACMQLHVHV